MRASLQPLLNGPLGKLYSERLLSLDPIRIFEKRGQRLLEWTLKHGSCAP